MKQPLRYRVTLAFLALILTMALTYVRSRQTGVYANKHFYQQKEAGYIYRNARIEKEGEGYRITNKDEELHAEFSSATDGWTVRFSDDVSLNEGEAEKGTDTHAEYAQAIAAIAQNQIRLRSNLIPLFIFALMYLIGLFYYFLPEWIARRYSQKEDEMVNAMGRLRRAGLISMGVSLVMMLYTHV